MRLAPLFVVAFVGLARADGPPATTEADRARGRQLVDGLAGRTERLRGETRLGFHAPERGRIGQVTISVGPAPAGVTAAHKVQVDAAIGQRTMRQSLLLDGRLGVTWLESTIGGRPTVRRAQRADGSWTWEAGDGAARRQLESRPATHYAEDWAVALVARAVPPVAATYELPGVAFGDDAARPSPVVLVVAAPAPVALHDGREVQALVVRAWTDGRGPVDHVVGLDGALLEVRSAGLVAAREPAKAPTAEEDLAAVRAAARVFMKVKVKALDADSLDEVVDWAALKASAQKANPALVELAVPDYAKLAKEAMRGEPAPPDHDPEKAFAALDGLIKLTIQGDAASAAVDGGRVLFRLRRVDGRWRITELP